MAEIHNIADPAALRGFLEAMDEGGLAAQQISNMGAIHVLEFILQQGCDPRLVIELLASLRSCLATCEEVATAKGYQIVHTPVAGMH